MWLVPGPRVEHHLQVHFSLWSALGSKAKLALGFRAVQSLVLMGLLPCSRGGPLAIVLFNSYTPCKAQISIASVLNAASREEQCLLPLQHQSAEQLKRPQGETV